MREIITHSEGYKPPKRASFWDTVEVPEHLSPELKSRFWIWREIARCRPLQALIDNAFCAGAANDLLTLTSPMTFKRLGPEETAQYVQLMQQHPDLVVGIVAEGAAHTCAVARPPEIPPAMLEWNRDAEPLEV